MFWRCLIVIHKQQINAITFKTVLASSTPISRIDAGIASSVPAKPVIDSIVLAINTTRRNSPSSSEMDIVSLLSFSLVL
jgi:hypothetical protein